MINLEPTSTLQRRMNGFNPTFSSTPSATPSPAPSTPAPTTPAASTPAFAPSPIVTTTLTEDFVTSSEDKLSQGKISILIFGLAFFFFKHCYSKLTTSSSFSSLFVSYSSSFASHLTKLFLFPKRLFFSFFLIIFVLNFFGCC